MRIVIMPSIVSSPKHWKMESTILHSSMLGRWATRTERAHVYLLAPGELPWLKQTPYFTWHAFGSLQEPEAITSHGCIPAPSDVLRFLKKIGPDIIIPTQSSAAAIWGSIIRSDFGIRSGALEIPMILWDMGSDTPDTAERDDRASGGWHVVTGQIMADANWYMSEPQVQAAILEVTRRFGYAAARRLGERGRAVTGKTDFEYMHKVAPPGEDKRPVFTVHIGGRWSATKKYDMLAEAAITLKATGEDIEVLYTGNPGNTQSARKAMGEAEFEVMKGLTQEEMWRTARTCHVGVLCQDPQNIPCMVLEHLGLGLPVLIRATEHTAEAMPQYPLVFSNVDELTALLLEVKENYDRYVKQVAEWWEDRRDQFKIDVVGPLLEDLTDRLVADTVTMPIKFDGEGYVEFVPRGHYARNLRASFTTMTLARREALRLGHEEDLTDVLPRFDLVDVEEEEEADEEEE